MVTNLALSMALLTVTLEILPGAMFICSIDRDSFPNNGVFASIVMVNRLFECNGPQEDETTIEARILAGDQKTHNKALTGAKREFKLRRDCGKNKRRGSN